MTTVKVNEKDIETRNIGFIEVTISDELFRSCRPSMADFDVRMTVPADIDEFMDCVELYGTEDDKRTLLDIEKLLDDEKVGLVVVTPEMYSDK